MLKGKFSKSLVKIAAAVSLLGFTLLATAGDLTPAMQKKVDAYKQKLVGFAADMEVIKATREANTKGPIAGMDNAKWAGVADNDPIAQGLVDNTAGKKLTSWLNQDAKGVNKMVLSDKDGNRIAFTSKPATYISKGKPHFDESIAGKVWNQPDVKPDPSTKIDTVQITAPVKDGGQVIGVLLMSLTAENLK